MAMGREPDPEDVAGDRRRSIMEQRMLRRAVHPGRVGRVIIPLEAHVPVMVFDKAAGIVMKQCASCARLGTGAWCSDCERQEAPKAWQLVDDVDDPTTW